MLRTLGYLLLICGVLAVIAAAIIRAQDLEGGRLVNALVPLLGGAGAVLLLWDRRSRGR